MVVIFTFSNAAASVLTLVHVYTMTVRVELVARLLAHQLTDQTLPPAAGGERELGKFQPSWQHAQATVEAKRHAS